MKCTICKRSETQPGTVTIRLEYGCVTRVAEGVPAEVCTHCGEAYVDEDAVEALLNTEAAPHERGDVED